MYNTGKKLVVKNKVRFTIFVIMVIALFELLMFAIISPSKTNADISHKTELVCVAVGDTLWDIAQEYCDNDTDIRETVYRIKKLNGLKSSDLVFGQTIIVPLD